MKQIRESIVEIDSERVPQHLNKLSALSTALAEQIASQLGRTEKTVALCNFCTYVAGELRQASTYYPNYVPGLAWCARNMFETNLTVRYVLASEANFVSWLGQCLRDEKDFIDGLLVVSKDQEKEAIKVQLRNRLSELDGLASRYGLKFAKPFRVELLARELDVHEEYVGLYKLFSKYVHPSSLLVNSWYKQEPAQSWTNIFLVKIQLYAGDTNRRIANAFGLGA